MDSVLLNEEWVNYLRERPETGMGYQMVTITMSDDSKADHTVLNCEHLLASPEFPVDQIKAIDVHEGSLGAAYNGTVDQR